MTHKNARWKKLIKPLLLFVIPIASWGLAHLVMRPRSTEPPVMISHRGIAGLAPENTLASLRQAIERGAKYIEADVQRTADGVLVLLHDRTVNRTTNGRGEIGKLTWDQVQKLDAGIKFSTEFAEEPIPSLDSALELLRSSSAKLVLEAKNPHLYPGIERQIDEAIKKYGLQDRVVVVSFDHKWLEQLKESAPDTEIGYLWLWTYKPPPKSVSRIVNVYWLSVILDPTFVRRMHNQGAEVWVWTVNDPRIMSLLRGLGVNAITTDHPERWIEFGSEASQHKQSLKDSIVGV